MERLTNEQMVWALNWAAYHLDEHDIKGDAINELNHCAKHFNLAAEKDTEYGRTKEA